MGLEAHGVSRQTADFRRKSGLLAGCWAHTRRAFYEALDHAPKEAGWILLQIGHLYRFERRLRKQQTASRLRAVRDAYRSPQSRPICARAAA
jgi:hypothetical protein